MKKKKIIMKQLNRDFPKVYHEERHFPQVPTFKIRPHIDQITFWNIELYCTILYYTGSQCSTWLF